MKQFESASFDTAACRAQIGELRKLLDENEVLRERRDILPFFRHRRELAAFIGGRFPGLSNPDRVAFEYDVFGDFTADLVVGSTHTDTYCFVEFEDAAPDSIFRTVKRRASPVWSPRFEQGYSQIVDWFWKLDDMRQTSEFSIRFGSKRVRFLGLLVIGRSASLGAEQHSRFRWRLDKTVVDSHHITGVTYEELLRDLEMQFKDLPISQTR